MSQGTLSTRAIVCFVEDNPHLVQQALALRQSWLFARCPDTDLVVLGPPAALARLPNDVVKLPQRPVADDPEWAGYRYANSVAALNGANAHRLDHYAQILVTDVDTFITPAWRDFRPDGFVCGTGGYSNDEDTRARIRRIATDFGLAHRGLTNTGSTWFGPTALVRRVGAMTEMLTRYILSRHFREVQGAWPGWYAGVTLLYAAEIAINHCVPDAGKTEQLDSFSTLDAAIGSRAHIHCWHTDRKFSKHHFMAGRYTEDDARNLNIDWIPDYAMEMSLRSRRDAQDIADGRRPRQTPGIRRTMINGSLQVRLPASSEAVPLDARATHVWSLCDGTRMTSDILRGLADVAPDWTPLISEVAATLSWLETCGLVVVS